MNVDVWALLADGERAWRTGDQVAARRAFFDAGLCAASYQLWRTALRCYRRVLELNVVDREPLARITNMPSRISRNNDWIDYAQAVDRHAWPPFGCRSAQIVISDRSALVECPGAGAVMDLIMPADDLIETRPTAQFTGMPLGMALIILRRAMWIAPRDVCASPASLRVTYNGRAQVRLDELGDWEQLVANPGNP